MNVGTIEKLKYMSIGREGENNAVDVVIDVSGWVDELAERGYNSLAFHVLFLPYGQSVPIACDANTYYDAEAGTLTWTITSSITQHKGLGFAEVRVTDYPLTGLLKKSQPIPTMITASVSGTSGGEIPAPYNDWVNQLLNMISDLNNALSNVDYMYALTNNYDDTPTFQYELPDLSRNKGKYFWTRTVISWSTGSTTNMDTRTYLPPDGEGVINSVNGLTGIVQLDGNDINVDDDEETPVTIRNAFGLKMDKTNIVYTTGAEPSSPVTGMIWLKKK